MITPAQFAYEVLVTNVERDFELRCVLEHADRGHEQTWCRSKGISLASGYFLTITCSCGAEFVAARIDTTPDNEKARTDEQPNTTT